MQHSLCGIIPESDTMIRIHLYNYGMTLFIPGDILIYDVDWRPWRALRVIHNQSKSHDGIIELTWSLDTRFIISSNQMVLSPSH